MEIFVIPTTDSRRFIYPTRFAPIRLIVPADFVGSVQVLELPVYFVGVLVAVTAWRTVAQRWMPSGTAATTWLDYFFDTLRVLYGSPSTQLRHQPAAHARLLIVALSGTAVLCSSVASSLIIALLISASPPRYRTVADVLADRTLPVLYHNISELVHQQTSINWIVDGDAAERRFTCVRFREFLHALSVGRRAAYVVTEHLLRTLVSGRLIDRRRLVVLRGAELGVYLSSYRVPERSLWGDALRRCLLRCAQHGFFQLHANANGWPKEGGDPARPERRRAAMRRGLIEYGRQTDAGVYGRLMEVMLAMWTLAAAVLAVEWYHTIRWGGVAFLGIFGRLFDLVW